MTFGKVICENQDIDPLEHRASDELEKWREEGTRVLKELIDLGSEKGNPLKRAWIGDCGVIESTGK